MCTSNRAVEDWLALWDDPILGNSTLDRLASGAHQPVVEGPSYRATLAPKNREAPIEQSTTRRQAGRTPAQSSRRRLAQCQRRATSPPLEELRALARQDERASRDQRRLRQDLLEVFLQALVAFPDLGRVSALAFLARWPSAEGASALSTAELERFLQERHHGWARRAAERIHPALAAEALAAPAHRAAAAC